MVKKSRFIKTLKIRNLIRVKKKKLSTVNKNDLLNLNKKKFKYFSQYINMLIKNGKRSHVEQGFIDIFRRMRKVKKQYPVKEYIVRTTNHCRPCIGFVSKKIGSITYKIPVSISMKREVFQSIYWIVKETCGLKKGNYKRALFRELRKIPSSRGNTIRIKRKLHGLAKYRRIYIRYLR